MHPLDFNIFGTNYEVIADPAAGTDIFWTPPTFARVMILNLRYRSALAAAGAARLHIIEILDGATVIHSAVAANVQTGGNNSIISWNAGAGALSGVQTLFNLGEMIPPWFILEPGQTLRTHVQNLQFLDQLSTVSIRWAQWIIGNN